MGFLLLLTLAEELWQTVGPEDPWKAWELCAPVVGSRAAGQPRECLLPSLISLPSRSGIVGEVRCAGCRVQEGRGLCGSRD